MPFIIHSQAKVFLSCPEPLTEFGSARDVGSVQENQDLDTCHDDIDRRRITKCCGTLLLHRFRETSSSVCYCHFEHHKRVILALSKGRSTVEMLTFVK